MVYISNGELELGEAGKGATAGLGGRISGFFHPRPQGLVPLAAFVGFMPHSQTRSPRLAALQRIAHKRLGKGGGLHGDSCAGCLGSSWRASDVGLAKVVFPLRRLCP